MRHALVILIALATAVPATGQDVAPDRTGRYRVMLTPEAGPSFPLPRFVIPGSVEVEANAVQLDSLLFRVDPQRNLVSIEPSVLDTTRDLIVSYRQLPLRAGPIFTLADTAFVPADTTAAGLPARRGPASEADDPFAGVSLQRRGSITRGVTTGSNRDVGVESGLRLELSGEIAEGVNVRAMLSDENTPILPEGTTRRLEEFDRIFIEIDAPVGTARLGDIDYRIQTTSFARLSRKLQGAAVESSIGTPGDAVGGVVSAAGAISRGQFRSQRLDILESVQGPYRLTGSQGEQFVLVIPGSETVYWDGRILERGENADYVVDYATGEITFTSNRIAAAERRVLVEFEYSTNQFTRTLLASQAETHFWRGSHGPRVRIGGAFIREMDGSRFLDEFGLTSRDSLRIVESGDAPAFRSGAEPVVFDPEAPYVQYIQRDTLLSDGRIDTFYVALERRPLTDETVYRVNFSTVGRDAGSYERSGRSLNGIVYTYVGPGRGNYAPVRLLPQPMQQQVFDLFGSVAVLPRLEIFGEWARSLHDRNRLSPLDSADDGGSALEGGLRLRPVDIGGAVQVSGQYRRRSVDAAFSAFDRIRPVEFGRHWNLEVGATAADAANIGTEVSDEALMQAAGEDIGELRVEVARLQFGETFAGRRFGVFGQSTAPGLPVVEYRGEWIGSTDSLRLEDGLWQRQLGSIRMPLLGAAVVPGFEVEHEHRSQEVLGSDSLSVGSFRFLRLSPGISLSTERFETTAEVSYRTDDEWLDGALVPAHDSWTSSVGSEYAGTRLSGDARIGYRRRTFSDTFRQQEGRADQSSLLIQTSARWRPRSPGVDAAVSYDATSERTPLLQEIFVRTGPELGQYVWEDLNNDGAVQVDELIPERTPNEGVYAKTYIPTDSLVGTVTVQARAELRLDGTAAWSRETGWRGALSNVTSRSAVDVVETTRDPDITRIYLLYLSRYRNPATTVNGRLRLTQYFTLWQGARRFSLDLGHNQIRSLNTRSAGTESQFFSTWTAESRWHISQPWTFRNVIAHERNRQESEQFASRRFDITGYRIEPEMIFRLHDRLRFSLPAAFAWKDDASNDRRATILRLPLEAQYQVPRRLTWTTRAEVARTELTGATLGLAEYELTDGRGPGTSWLWNTSMRYSINEYLRASLQYDGRAPEGAPVIHAFRMQLSAVF